MEEVNLFKMTLVTDRETEIIGIDAERLLQILSNTISVETENSIGEIQGLKFAQIPSNKSNLIIPGQKQEMVPCVIIKVDWKLKEIESHDDQNLPELQSGL